ncbi:FCSD flavin-binding domain-containing protein [Bosea sp. 117]|uniref:FCSD flavin-binding domain-containing protein n=1 Tax=Bosea sp. 117 TaxID=1125973 RepID=UPI00049432A7|nr:FCSD flavin-binding domain-containing protein [Bosea sp. 117]
MAAALSRRALLGGLALGALAMPAVARAATPRVAIVGAGFGGAALASELASGSGGVLDVVLVEPEPGYVALCRSNLVLGGIAAADSIRFGYDELARRAGIRLVRARAARIDADRRAVRLEDGTALPYDAAAMAPGIALDYASVPGWGRAASERMPHGWIGRAQFELLDRQLAAVPDGGLIVILPPPDPSRCPPAPYERASMMAHRLRATGRGDCRIVILDSKERFAKMALFLEGWERYYPGMIEWLPPSIHEGIEEVDPATMTVRTGFGVYRNCALVNVIPAQTAGIVALESGLTDQTGFCPVRPEDMGSVLARDVLVLGDAAQVSPMPKSASAAASQSAVVAAALRSRLLGADLVIASYSSTCWSLLAPGDSVTTTGDYAVEMARMTEVRSYISSLTDTPLLRHNNADDYDAWFSEITGRIFSQ